MQEYRVGFKVAVTDTTSGIVQEVLFECGYTWKHGESTVRKTDYKFLYVDTGECVITHGNTRDCFDAHYFTEVKAEEV